MSLIHILNNYHNPFPHLNGRGGLQFHPSRHIIGGALSNEVALQQISDLLTQVEQPIERLSIDTSEDDEIRERLAQYEQSQSILQQASEPEPEKLKIEENEGIFKQNGELYAHGSISATVWRNACKKRGLSTEGSRQELYTRLNNFLKKQKEDKIIKKSKKKTLKEIQKIESKDEQFLVIVKSKFPLLIETYKQVLGKSGILNSSDISIAKEMKDDIIKIIQQLLGDTDSDYTKTLIELDSYVNELDKIIKTNTDRKKEAIKEAINKKKKEEEELLLKKQKAKEISTDLEIDEMDKEFEADRAKEKEEEGRLITKFSKYKGEIPEKLYGKAMTHYNGHGRLGHYKAQMEQYIESLKSKPETLSLPEPEIQANVLKAQQETELRKKIQTQIDEVCRSRGLLFKDAKDYNQMINKGVEYDRKSDDQITNYVNRAIDEAILDTPSKPSKIEFYTESPSYTTKTDYKKIDLIQNWISYNSVKNRVGLGKSFEAYFESPKRMKILQGSKFDNDKSPIINNDVNPLIPLNYPDGRPIIRIIKGKPMTLRDVCITDLGSKKNIFEMKQRDIDFTDDSGTVKAVDINDSSIPYVPFQITKFGDNTDYKIHYVNKNGKWYVYNIMMTASDIGDNGFSNYIFDEDYKNYYAVFLTVDGIYTYDICNDITNDKKLFGFADKSNVNPNQKRILVQPIIKEYDKKGDPIYLTDDGKATGNILYEYYTTSYSREGKTFLVDKNKFKKL